MVKKERIEIDDRISALSPLEERIMEYLWNHGPSHVSKISESIGISISSVAATLDRLVRHGFVERRQEKIDGRRKYVYYAKLGKTDIERKFVEGVLDKLMSNFGEIVAEYFHKRGIKP
jgi:DNA-binding MarR family transcriptional regulator